MRILPKFKRHRHPLVTGTKHFRNNCHKYSLINRFKLYFDKRMLAVLLLTVCVHFFKKKDVISSVRKRYCALGLGLGLQLGLGLGLAEIHFRSIVFE